MRGICTELSKEPLRGGDATTCGTEVIYKTLWSKREFCENPSLLKAEINFYPYFPYYFTDLGKI